MFAGLSLILLLAIFAGCAAVIWIAGVQLADTTDILSSRLHLGKALGGIIVLAVATNLPEIAITVSASLSGELGVAVGNILGGIGIQTLVLVAMDVAMKEKVPLTYRAASLSLVIEAVRCFKQRGDNVQVAAYAYAAENGVSYTERLASVREVDPDTVDEFKRAVAQRADEEVVKLIADCVADGFNTKMMLGKEAAARAGVSVRHAYRLVEKYTGEDPAQHRWKFTVRDRGAKQFELLSPPPS